MAVVDVQTIARAAGAAGFPRDQLATAVAVALAESGGDATVTNTNIDGTIDHGLWQINSVHAGDLAAGNWRDPASNARMAFAVWSRADRQWTPWTAWRNGQHLPRMAEASAAVAAITQGGNNPWIPDFIERPADAAGEAIDAGRDTAARVNQALQVLTDRDFWVRVAMVAVGGSLLVVAVVGLLWALAGKSTIVNTAKGITR